MLIKEQNNSIQSPLVISSIGFFYKSKLIYLAGTRKLVIVLNFKRFDFSVNGGFFKFATTFLFSQLVT